MLWCLLAAAGAAWSRGAQPDVFAAVVLAAGGALLAVEDFADHRLPDAILGPTAIAVTALLCAAAMVDGTWSALLRGALAAAGCGLLYLLLALLRPAGLGLGDVKLGALLGLWLGWLGWETLALGVLAGFLLGGAAGLTLIAARRATRRSAIAFGPWLLLGAAVASVLPGTGMLVG